LLNLILSQENSPLVLHFGTVSILRMKRKRTTVTVCETNPAPIPPCVRPSSLQPKL